jgi:hypothetical protein
MEAFALALTGLTLIATILGWFLNYRKQQEVLDRTRGGEVADRELSVFRERKDRLIPQIVEQLADLLDGIPRLIAFAFGGKQENVSKLRDALKEAIEIKDGLFRLYQHPDFFQLTYELPREFGDRLFGSIAGLSENWSQVLSQAVDHFESPTESTGMKLSDTLYDTLVHARKLREVTLATFASLEVAMSYETKKPPSQDLIK